MSACLFHAQTWPERGFDTMKMRIAIAICTGAALMQPLALRPRAAQALLIELDPRAGALAAAVSANNFVVVGALDGGGGFYSVPGLGVIFNGGNSSEDVSGDGRTIVGIAKDAGGVSQAGIWLGGTSWRLLGSFTPTAAPCDKLLSSAYGVSRDGQVVVGLAWDGCKLAHAFRWQASSRMVDLGSTVQGRASLASAVSANGSVVVGYQERADGVRQGARWVNGRQELIPGQDGFVGQASGTNIDGSIVVGRTCRPSLGNVEQSAWAWTAQGGTKCLPAPKLITVPGPGAGPLVGVEAKATSDDGQIIGGGQDIGGSADSNAIIWLGGRPAYLKDLLQVNGVPGAFATWVNTGEITGMTPDGHILVGWGAAALGFRGYIVVLPSNPVIPS
jgi:probable HAF family extracellular repeat protein